MASIFTKIINQELPSYKIHENQYTYSFLTSHQIQLGHTLIVPKKEIDYFVDVEEPYFSEVFKVSKPIAKAIHKATKCKRVGTIIAGWDVPHFHYHVVPMFDPSDLSFEKAKILDKEKMEKIQNEIIKYLDKF